MLAGLGTVGDVDRDATLLPDVATLEAEVVDDLYLRKYAGDAAPALALAHRVERQRRLPARLRPVDLDDAPPGVAANAERVVEAIDRFAIAERARLTLPTIRRALAEGGLIDLRGAA